MSYRDELAAARARNADLEQRLEELEEELADARAPREPLGELPAVIPGVRDRLKSYREKLEAAEKRLKELGAAGDADVPGLMRQLAAARARVTELERERDAAGLLATMPTIVQRHRAGAPLTGGPPLGVLCPLCIVAGDHVEMFGAGDGGIACCPRCRYEHAWSSPGE